jgi:Chaperone of endosialidase
MHIDVYYGKVDLRKTSAIALWVLAMVGAHTANAQTNTYPASGYVGMGTTTPTTALHIKDNTTASILTLEGGDTNGVQLEMKANTSGYNHFTLGVVDDSHPWGAGFYLYNRATETRSFWIDDGNNIHTVGSLTLGDSATVGASVWIGGNGFITGNTYLRGTVFMGPNPPNWTPTNTNVPNVAARIDGNTVQAGFHYSVSDRSTKENITLMSGSLDKIMAIKPVQFSYKSAPGETRFGVIADEIESVLPNIVGGEKGQQAVAYEQLIPLLVQALQEQQREIAALKHTLGTQTE